MAAPFEVQLRDVQRVNDGPHLLVSMTATFANRGTERYRADPGDFRLRDGAGAQWPATLDGGPRCAAWPVTPVQPQAELGPVPLCFVTASAPTEPLEVMWHPDVSFFLLAGPPAVILLP
jgi:hypothetical protein